MKKNLFLKLAAVALVLCLASTCAIGTTFAKYVTGDKASDTARVAKWGVTVSASGTLFGTHYSNSTGGNTITDSSATNISVASSNSSNLVAPGTKNDTGFQLTLTGTPEVAYAIAVSYETPIEDVYLATGSYGVMTQKTDVAVGDSVTGLYTLTSGTYEKASGTAVSGTDYYKFTEVLNLAADYYPIQWKVNAGTAQTNLSTVVSAITTDIGSGGAANVALNKTYTLTWEWMFDNSKDAEDTLLGDLMAGVTNNLVASVDSGATYAAITVSGDNVTSGANTVANLNVNFSIKVDVTQVD